MTTRREQPIHQRLELEFNGTAEEVLAKLARCLRSEVFPRGHYTIRVQVAYPLEERSGDETT